jgi:hypothetical protein
MSIETEIYQIIESIVEKNVRIQQADYSQEIKDNAMRIADNSVNLTEEYLSDITINRAVIQAYKDKKK